MLVVNRPSAFTERYKLPVQKLDFRKGLGACGALLNISNTIQKALGSSSLALVGRGFW